MNAQRNSGTHVPFRLDFADAGAADRASAAVALLKTTPAARRDERARLEAVCAAAWSGNDPAAAAAAAARAEREAADTDDDLTHAWAILARCVADLSPDATTARIAGAREVLRLAQSLDEPVIASTAFLLLVGGIAECGLTTQLDIELGRGPMTTMPAQMQRRRHTAWFRAMRATLDGQTETAEALANKAHTVATSEGDPDADSVWMGQLAILRWFEGRYSELENILLRGRQAFPGEPVWTASLAWVWLQQGRRSAAHGLISSLPPLGLFARDRNWLCAVSILAVVASEIGDLQLGAATSAALEPFADRVATIGLGVTCWGVVARPLALLALSRGDTAAAIAHYRTAITVSARAGAHAWLAEAQAELAQVLAAQRDAASTAEATLLTGEATATARALHLHPVTEAARAARASLTAAPPGPVLIDLPVADASPPRPSISVLGRFEVVSIDGERARWRSRKARELLKILVARRGSAIERENLMDLLWPGEDPEQLANRLAVAVNAIRRAFDPDRLEPADSYVVVESRAIHLRVDRVDIDAEQFLCAAEAVLASPELSSARKLAEVLALRPGDALIDEPDAHWAERLRREVHLAFFAISHALAEASLRDGDHLARIEAYQGVLAVDNYDQRAHEGLIDALTLLGAHGRAEQARASFDVHMSELGIAAASAG